MSRYYIYIYAFLYSLIYCTLCFRYWQIIEFNGFDPVMEYNKSVEEFEMHFHPSNEDLVKIILQLSRFFKEFGDFELVLTP